MKTKQIQIHITCNNLIEEQQIKELLQKVAELPAEVQQKLSKMITPKGVKMLENNWTMIKTFI